MDTEIFIYLEFIRKALAGLPGIEEKPCFGTPAFYVNKKLFCRIREDGETVMVNSVERDKWMKANPEIFFITDHYLNYNSLLVNLKLVSPADLTQLLVTAWYNRAPKKMVAIYESKHIPIVSKK